MGLFENLLEDKRRVERNKQETEAWASAEKEKLDYEHNLALKRSKKQHDQAIKRKEEEARIALEQREKNHQQEMQWEAKKHLQEEEHEEEKRFIQFLEFIKETPNIAEERDLVGYMTKLIPLIERNNHWNTLPIPKIEELALKAEIRFKENLDLLPSLYPESKLISYFEKKYSYWQSEEWKKEAEEICKNQTMQQTLWLKQRKREAGEAGVSGLLTKIKSQAQGAIDKVSVNTATLIREKKETMKEDIKGIFKKLSRD